MQDVTKYVQRIGRRLSEAFSFESFDVEDELEFWRLASEHLSKSKSPAFRDIVDWVDSLYHAPAHFVYVKTSEQKLELFRRMVLPENLEHTFKEEKTKGSSKSQSVMALEQQLNDFRPLIRLTPALKDYGFTSFPLGQCYHIPLYKEEEFFGIYCVAPYVENPEAMTPRLPIVSRILSTWISQHYQEEYAREGSVKKEVQTDLGKLSTGSLNFEGYGKFFLNYLTKTEGIKVAALVEFGLSGQVVAQRNIDDSQAFEEIIQSIELEGLSAMDMGDEMKQTLSQSGLLPQYLHIRPLNTEKKTTFLLIGSAIEEDTQFLEHRSISRIYDMLSTVANYREKGFDLAGQLIDMYYHMIRELEKKKERHRYHTDRMLSLTSVFADYYGMSGYEKLILEQTAKLHDIGYLSIDLTADKKTMGAELEHPLLGEQLVKYLPIDQEVVKGIKTHHEWVDGSGIPDRLQGEAISWSGKIAGLFEYLTEFIEAHRHDENKMGKEWLKELESELIDRTDIQFDMVLIPTVIEMINDLGWNQLCKMGEDE
ncbi:HD-GYP domain-containing protein [Fodinibius salsisoli]|uniref:HD domain-containing protein n=1 Tax=Fodinibius salsisoli TaxID=2820877 RepID=A0ABT3PR21_9BACT|nr:HD domain-containing phosphohydrolase [Fodinibius salsisoli]MCW9708310.1 HD domain-containing protein [Fodinibius salsisoli]